MEENLKSFLKDACDVPIVVRAFFLRFAKRSFGKSGRSKLRGGWGYWKGRTSSRKNNQGLVFRFSAFLND